jgi:hypothetical protein
MEGILGELRYSTDDRRCNRPNTSGIPIDGDIYNGLATCRGAEGLCREFRLATQDGDPPPVNAVPVPDHSAEDFGQRTGLERDMQASLRLVIDKSEPGLVVTDSGAERQVESGLIDIAAKDKSGAAVVIELKAGAAGQRAVPPILSYTGDIATEDDAQPVRGVLVAFDFDARARSAARMVPNLALRRHAVRFTFSEPWFTCVPRHRLRGGTAPTARPDWCDDEAPVSGERAELRASGPSWREFTVLSHAPAEPDHP